MNLGLTFKINAIITLLNGLGSLFASSFFLSQAGFNITSDLITLAQFVGATFIFLSILSWRIPDIAGESLKSLGYLFAIGSVIWFLMIGFHIITSAVSGPTAYVNIIIIAIFAILFFLGSRK